VRIILLPFFPSCASSYYLLPTTTYYGTDDLPLFPIMPII
jgi:hypothetical protein